MKAFAIAAVVLVAGLSVSGPAGAEESIYRASLSGADEVPAVLTDGTGNAKFELDGASVEFELRWKNLSGPAIAGHIHCGVPGVGGPVGVTLLTGTHGPKGEVEGNFNAPNPNNGCGWMNLTDVLDAMANGKAYVNIHTPEHPAGEIRGQVIQQ